MVYPVPYTKNWKQHFGQQNYPVPPADAAANAPIAVILSVGAEDNTVILDFAGGSTVHHIEWGDGTSTPDGITGATHTYTRNGSYLISVADADYPSNIVRAHFRVSNIASNDSGPGAYAPHLSSPPSMSPTPQVGVEITCSGFEFSSNIDTEIMYWWLLDGAAIDGATNSTYTPQVGDVGKKLSCIVAAVNHLGHEAVSTPQETIIAAAVVSDPQDGDDEPQDDDDVHCEPVKKRKSKKTQ